MFERAIRYRINSPIVLQNKFAEIINTNITVNEEDDMDMK
jgi:hypothetical protein